MFISKPDEYMGKGDDQCFNLINDSLAYDPFISNTCIHCNHSIPNLLIGKSLFINMLEGSIKYHCVCRTVHGTYVYFFSRYSHSACNL